MVGSGLSSARPPPKPPNIVPRPEPALTIHCRIPINPNQGTPVLPHHTTRKDTPVLPPCPRVSFGHPLRETAEEVLGEYTPFYENISDPGKRATSQQMNWKLSTPSESGLTDFTLEFGTIHATQEVDIPNCHIGINQQLKEKDNNKVWPPSLILILQKTMATPCCHPIQNTIQVQHVSRSC